MIELTVLIFIILLITKRLFRAVKSNKDAFFYILDRLILSVALSSSIYYILYIKSVLGGGV